MKFDRFQPNYSAVEIALIYAIIGSLWIVLSDRAIDAVFETPHIVTELQTLKGWGFVLVTSLLLYGLVRRSVRSLQRSYNLLYTVLESTTDAIFAKDIEGRYVLANSASARALKLHLEEMLGATDEELLEAETARQIRQNDRQVLARGGTQLFKENVLVENRPTTFLTTKDVWYDPRGKAIGIIGISRDITEIDRARQALAESERRYRLLFECHPQPLWVYDLETLAFLAVNHAAIDAYGYSEAEFLEMTIADIRPSEDVPQLLDNVAQVGEGIDRAGLWRHIKKDGSTIDVEITSHPLEFDGRRAEVVLANDVTERLAVERRLERYAFCDLVTGLPNRNNFLTYVERAMTRVRRRETSQFAVLYLSLDNFVRLKFSLGHDLVEQMLVQAATRLGSVVPEAVVTRVESNEFAVLLEATPSDIDASAERIQA
ncbi:PAS domain-containing protein [Baaleninema sp.]|uniref:PAS domain-containing protein n=1 Tax=Baaleninema sp. TaxID=3101197 RepID=UPI003CFCF3A1